MPANDENGLVGTWKLLSCVGNWSDGRVTHPYGESPSGRLVYDSGGNFAGQIQADQRPLFQSGNLLKGEPEEIKAAFEGYVAYYGTYAVDEETSSVTHHVQGSLFPNWTGKDQLRMFSFESGETGETGESGKGVRLRLTTPPFVGKRSQMSLTLVWERLNG